MKIPFTERKLEDKDVSILFWRSWERHHRLGKHRKTTTCLITVFSQDWVEPEILEGVGKAYLRPGDEFEEHLGWELSFKKAVADLPKDVRHKAWRLWLTQYWNVRVSEKTTQTEVKEDTGEDVGDQESINTEENSENSTSAL